MRRRRGLRCEIVLVQTAHTAIWRSRVRQASAPRRRESVDVPLASLVRGSKIRTHFFLRYRSGDQGKTRPCGRRACVAGAPKHRQRILSVRPGGWSRTSVNSSGTGVIRVLQTAAQWVTPPGQPFPPPHPPLQSTSEGIGGARGLGNLVRPESHPEPRGFPVQWADPGVKPAIKSSDRPVRPRPRARVATGRSDCSHRFTGRLSPCKVCHCMRVPLCTS